MLGSFVEAGNVHIAHARTDHEMQIHAVAGDFRAGHGKVQGLFGVFAQHGDVHGGAFGAFQQIGHVAGVHVVSGFAIYCRDNVAGANARFVRRTSREGSDDDDAVVARADFHAYAVVVATLVFLQQSVSFGIKKIGVRIKHMQHAGNCTVINRFVGIHGVGIVLLDDAVHVGKFLHAFANVGVTAGGRGGVDLLSEDQSQKTAKKQNENYQEE